MKNQTARVVVISRGASFSRGRGTNLSRARWKRARQANSDAAHKDSAPIFAPLFSKDDLHTLFALVFVLGGLATGSSRIANNNMMLTIAPPHSRATYLGFLNTLLGLVTFISVIGGLVVDTLGFTVLFLIALLLAALALIAGARMSTTPRY